MLLWFLPIFLILIMVGLPVIFALLASPFALIMLEGDNRNVVAGLYRNLYNGIKFGVVGKEMPAWGKVLSDSQVADLTEYVYRQFIDTEHAD